MGTIVWLASYPKSGNTWVRVFLTNYVRDTHEPAGINDLEGGPIASARDVFDELVGVEASDLTAAEIARYRPAVYRRMSSESAEPIFMKVHDAYRHPDAGSTLFPADATGRVIYIIRNPLDLSVSLAHHHSVPIDDAVERVCAGYSLARSVSRLNEQLEQVLLSWGDHVRSWVDDSGLPVLVARFEDMKRDPLVTFGGIVDAAGLEQNADRVARAVQFSRFEILQAQEQEEGFRERPPRAPVFFRKGRVGDWRNALTPGHAERIINAHGALMTRFGYLTTGGEPVF